MCYEVYMNLWRRYYCRWSDFRRCCVWYGGGAVDLWYFFDAETDALISLKGGMMFFTDQPLSLPGYDRVYVVKEAE